MYRNPLSLLLLSGVLAAQGFHVVPGTCASNDGNSSTTMVGAFPKHWQMVIDPASIASMSGHAITALRFRRDSSFPEAFNPASWNLVVRMGEAALDSNGAQPNFASNAVSLVEVFRGIATAPASAALSGTASWSTTDTVEVALSNPFVVPNAGLVIDVEGSSIAGDWWPIDAVDDPSEGQVQSLGVPCGSLTSWQQTASVDRSQLLIGRTATFELAGEPGAPAYLLVGAAPTSLPIDMSVIGAPGCFLHLLPFAAIGRVVGAPQFTAEFGGTAWVDLHLPADANLLGASLTTQWFEWQTTGFAFSNALAVQVSANPPSLGMALVTGQIAGTPVVRSYGIPVLGFVTD